MTLLTMTIPDDPAELPRWLERRLMAPDFGRFVAELSAHFPATAGTAPPRHLLDRWLPVALDEGLDPLPADVLSQLLRHPAELAAFQERIVTDGGAYWDDVPGTARTTCPGRLQRGKRSLERMLSADAPRSNGKAIPKASGPKAVPSEASKRTGRRGYKIWAIVSTGVAACLAVAVGLLAVRGPGEPPIPKAQIAWGWGKPGGLAADQSNPRGLPEQAGGQRRGVVAAPTERRGLGSAPASPNSASVARGSCTRRTARSARPTRRGCWRHCRAWAKALDGHQQALDAGADPLAVRAEVDETVRAIAAALREKAKQVG